MPPSFVSDTEAQHVPPGGQREGEDNAKAENEFDDGANEFWSVYVGDARSHDEASIGSWKDDMEGVIIFAGLYSAALTAFVVERAKGLSPDPADENTFYTRQAVALLTNISAQLAASGSPVPSSVPLPPEFPKFHATQSDVRVNTYWFMSLVFSLSAALAATLVQQWVREYVHLFQRYNHPLKCARVRQFLYDGSKSWHMEVVVNLVPALIHISLFLFFLGLADFLFSVNTATATATTTVIVLCSLCYLFTIIAPVFYPQSPYQSPLSGLFWYLVYRTIQKGGNSRHISFNMTHGRMQLATDMSEDQDRKLRDVNSIKWVVHDLTEDSELEPLIRNIPGSLNSDWGKNVWKVVEDENRRGILEYGEKESFLSLLDRRITRLIKTCIDLGAFSTKAERDRRAHACIGASLSLALFVRYDWTWLVGPEIQTMAQVLCLGDDVRELRDVPRVSNDPPILPREKPTVLRSDGPTALRDESTVLRNLVTVLRGGSTVDFESTSSIRLTCMSIMVVSTTLQSPEVRNAAKGVIKRLAMVREERDDGYDDEAAKTTKTIDKYLKTCWDSANSLHQEFIRDVDLDNETQLRTIVQEKMHEITTLDDTWNIFGWAEETDKAIVRLTQTLKDVTGNVLHRLPDTVLLWQPDSRQVPDRDTRSALPYFMPQFIPPRLLILRLWLCVPVLHTISTTGWGASKHMPEELADLSTLELNMPWMIKLMHETQHPMEIQLWRVQDLRVGGLFYTLELFIAAIKSSPKVALLDTAQELYEGTFRFITRKWRDYERSEWRERLLVDLLRRVLPASDDLPSERVPDYIINLFLPFVAHVLADQTESHVEDAVMLIEAYRRNFGDSKVLRDVLSKLESRGRQSISSNFEVKLPLAS